MKPSDIIQPLTQAKKVSGTVSNVSVHDASLAEGAKTVVADGKKAGLSAESADLKRKLTQDARYEEMIDAIDALFPSSDLHRIPFLHVMTAGLPVRMREEIFLRGAITRDRKTCRLKAIMLAKGNAKFTRSILSAMEGDVREMLVKLLPEVRQEILDGMETINQLTRGKSNLQPIDTGILGTVKLATKENKKGERLVELGTDRILGVGRIAPQEVDVVWKHSGETGKIRIAGELDVHMAIEIKGYSTAHEGIEQLRMLGVRGDRYIQIGDQFWLVKYDPAKVRHIVIAPPKKSGKGTIERARKRAAEDSREGRSTIVVEIPQDVEDEIIALAREYLELAQEELRLAK